MIPDGKFIEKLIASFTVKSGDFSLKTVAAVSSTVVFWWQILPNSQVKRKKHAKSKHSQIQIDIILVPSKMPNYAVSPDLFHVEISFSSTCNIPKHCFSRKTRSYLKLMRTYFVFWKDLILILTIQKVCDWFTILQTKISMLNETIICSDWNFLMGNNGPNQIPAPGRCSRKGIFCDCTPEK